MVSLWLVAALVLIPAVQVPLVLYLSRYVAVEESELPSLASSYASPASEQGADEYRTSNPSDAAICPRCGTKNDLGYRFCRECASLL
jgi:hypothetical protein